MSGTIFHTVEIDVEIPGTAAQFNPARGWGTAPQGALTQLPQHAGSTETLRFSDLGYVDEAHRPYPPLVSQAFAIDRRLDLVPSAGSSTEAWGSVTFANPYGMLDNAVRTRVVDHQPVRVAWGAKRRDLRRGIDLDPPSTSLAPAFTGLGQSWQPDLYSVSIGLQDVSYWLDTVMSVPAYTGSGALGGDSNVAGRLMPRLRGAVLNITPVLIDAVNLVYQVSDGPGAITALFEGGLQGGIIDAGQTDDLYANPPDPGHYVVQASGSGLYFRLGTKPVYAITVDATGYLPDGTSPGPLLDLLRGMIVQDLAIPASVLDPGWATGLSWAPWPGGWFWDGTTTETGRTVVDAMLSGLGVRLIPSRSGTLRPVQIASPSGQPVAALDGDTITAVSAVALDASLDPPPWRWRVGYQHVVTVQAAGSGLSPQITAERQALVAQADRIGSWISQDIRARYRVPNDPALLATALARQSDAQAVAAVHGALWSAQRRIWAVSVPKAIGYGIDLGDVISVTWPVPGLENTALGLVVGEQLRSDEPTVTLQILTNV